ncbi:substrate-binding domain-containing protein [Streptomyces carpinensis]|uniref:Substrate-binding domain-containing protein n=2 Tax=Streptomyces carpinensis TaxID=66369 RepID=A0ABV1VW24_9ACTN
MSVVGFADLPEAHWAAPPLTAVCQPPAEMAPIVLWLLVRLMTGEQPAATRTDLSTRLVVRRQRWRYLRSGGTSGTSIAFAMSAGVSLKFSG